MTRIAIIIPACDEEECIAHVLTDLLAQLDSNRYVVAVGVNDSSDCTAEIARGFPVIVAETPARGYGYGCEAAINALHSAAPEVSAYIFFAADGASDPRDIAGITKAHEQGYAMVLGARTTHPANWPAMGLSHVLANLSLGGCCGLLTGRWFRDLGPLRLIERRLFEQITPREMTFGWTIEAQIAAALLRASIIEVPAQERPRLAGRQKVSGVSWRRTFLIGCRIVAAGWRTRLRFQRKTAERVVPAPSEVLAESSS